MKDNFKHIHLTGEVDDKMFQKLLQGLAESKDKAIIIHLSTLGGDVYSAFGIYDLIKYSDLEIKIVTHGACMSAGIIILMAAERRVAMKNCQFMVHYGSEYIEGETDAQHSKKITKNIKEMIKNGTKLKQRKINSLFKGDNYFNAKEALEMGFINGIEK